LNASIDSQAEKCLDSERFIIVVDLLFTALFAKVVKLGLDGSLALLSPTDSIHQPGEYKREI
jgi:hypothetical protein